MTEVLSTNWDGQTVANPLTAELKRDGMGLSLELRRCGERIGEVYIELDALQHDRARMRVYTGARVDSEGEPNAKYWLDASPAAAKPSSGDGVRAELHDDAEQISVVFDAEPYFETLSGEEFAKFAREGRTNAWLRDDVVEALIETNHQIAAFFTVKPPEQPNGETNGYECAIDWEDFERYAARRAAVTAATTPTP